MTQPQLYMECYGDLAQQRLGELIAQVKASDSLAPVTVVVPTPFAGLSLRRSLAKAGGLINVRFMVMARLAEYLGSSSMAREGKEPLSPLVEIASVRAVAKDITSGPLASVAGHPRLHASLQATFREMAHLSEDDILKLEEKDQLRQQVVRWRRLYRQRVSGFLTDREDVVRAAVRAIETDTAEPALRDLGTVIVYLIGELSPAEAALVSALGQQRRALAIFGLTGYPDVDKVTQERAARLEPALGQARHGANELSGAQAEHMVSACDTIEEVRWVLRDITRRAESGLAFHEMAVLYRQRDHYGFLVPGQMALAGLPVSGPDPTPLRDTPAGRVLSLLIEVVRADYSREVVMRWLAEAPVRITGRPDFSGKRLAQWDFLSRRAGVVRGYDAWIKQLTQHQQYLSHELTGLKDIGETDPAKIAGLQSLVDSAGDLVLFIQKLVTDLTAPAEGSWEGYANWAKGLLQEYCQDPVTWHDEHRASYERLEKLLEEMGSLSNEIMEADLPSFQAILEEGMERPSGRTGPTGSGVFAGSLAEAQGMQFEVVYIVGMAEGSFPPAPADDPLLPDQVRESLDAGERLPLRRARRIEEHRMYLAALAAGRKRVLLYPRADNAAMRAQYPAPWFLDEASRWQGSPVTSAEVTRLANQPWLSVIQSAEDSLNYVDSIGPADAHDYDLASIARWRKARWPLSEHFLAQPGDGLYQSLQVERHRSSPAFTAWDGRLSDMVGTSQRLSLPEDRPISPTRLERWVDCPFRYFLGDVIGIAALESPEELWTISPLERGSLVHRILEQFMREVGKRKTLPAPGQPWEAKHQALMREITNELFDEAETAGITGRRLFWSAAKEEIRQDLLGFLEADSQWRAKEGAQPVWIEQRFGFSGGLPAPEVSLPGGQRLRFRGLIDRVDRTPDGRAFVFDYKTGSSYSFRDIKDNDPTGQGRHLQLPVYALAVQAGMQEVTGVEASYWFVTLRNGFERKPVALEEAQKPFQQAVEAVIEGIRQGLFPAIPGPRGAGGKFENCHFCDFDRVCPANRDIAWESKGTDQQIANLRGRLGPAESDESGEEGE